ncbi:MAG: Xaa-Pro peptidase family protein, partial [Acidobacteria bacterium]|nr:Xaa-Pro peptidase family protein [Acidobacteriota bacterium]
YLTGFFGSAGLALVTADTIRLISDSRYDAVVRRRQREWPVVVPIIVPSSLSYEEALIGALGDFAGRRVGFEESHLTVRRHRTLTAAPTLAPPRAELVPTDGLVEGLRAVKDAWEVGILRDAAARLSTVAKRILPTALVGLTEREVAGTLEAGLRQVGFERPAFDTIVAAGANSALPHHRAGDERIERGDLVVIDVGGVLDGYAVDLTRTMVVGAANGRQRKVLDAVAAAQDAAMAAVAPGVAPEAVDQAARRILAAGDYGEAFTHGTGHGLGLEIHERPRVGPPGDGSPEPLLSEAMVFTIEPGAYFPGWGGVRIEDDVVVTASGGERLTDVPVWL